ncbi:MAG: DUF2917 domain-containing protein [Comamonas sp.]|nr:DUF2917 domain-containing protein [Comamonas sp.]
MKARTSSTDALPQVSVLIQIHCRCGWQYRSMLGKVGGMNSALATSSWKTLSLQAAASVQTMHLGAGLSLCLQAQSGIVWLTCEGQPRDYFLQAGELLRFDGPARLYLGTQGSQDATLRWSRARVRTSSSPAAGAAPTVPANAAAA